MGSVEKVERSAQRCEERRNLRGCALGCRVSVSGFGCGVGGFGFRVPGFGLRVWGVGFLVPGFGVLVSVFGCWSSGFGCEFRVSVWGLGFLVSVEDVLRRASGFEGTLSRRACFSWRIVGRRMCTMYSSVWFETGFRVKRFQVAILDWELRRVQG